MIDQDKIIYNKIRELVVGLSYTYSEKMTKVVAQTLTQEPDVMKQNLNAQLSMMINTLLDEMLT